MVSEEVLKNRVIKKVKCRNVGFEFDIGGVFKGFKGLVVFFGGGCFFGFGSGVGGKFLEGLLNGNNIISVFFFVSVKVVVDFKVVFGFFVVNGFIILVDKVLNFKINGDS